MRICYVTPFCVLRARTNQIADMRLCEGFAQNGCDVELISMYAYRPDNLAKSDVFPSYGIRQPYKLTIVPTPLWDAANKYASFAVQMAFGVGLSVWILIRSFRSTRGLYVMSRSVSCLLPFVVLKRLRPRGIQWNVVPWLHEVPVRTYQVWVLQKADYVVATNSQILRTVHERYAVPSDRMALSLNPITSAQAQTTIDKLQAREKLGLASDKPLVVYTGKLAIGMREIGFILEAAARVPEYHFLFTGGKPEVVAYYERYCDQRGISNVSFAGYLHRYVDVQYYQFAADVLVSYYTPDQHLVQYNLPNKICEYMLTGNPIVTPDFPATRDILHQGNAFFVEPENTDSLVEGLRSVVEDRDLARQISAQARHDVEGATFQRRTQIILDLFRGKCERPLQLRQDHPSEMCVGPPT
jgi:glycosyltransferase involved in cell wall biosynthesis